MAETGTVAFSNYKKLAAICALFAVFIGLSGLCGWLFDNNFLKTFFSGGATMKVNTALLILLSGGSLFFQVSNKITAARIAADAVVLLCLAVVVEYAVGVNLHIDEFFVKDLLTDPLKEAPGRTSLLTAVSGLMMGIALWALSNKHVRFAQLLGSVVFTVVYISLIGHVFNINGFYQLGKYSGVAFHTALGIISIVTGLLMAERQQGWIGLLYRRLNDRPSALTNQPI
jgi:hypothetical protein